MKQNILQTIKETEKKTERILASAEKKKANAIDAAKKKALTLISDKQEELDASRDEALRKHEKVLLDEKKRIIEDGEQEVEQLKEKATRNIDRAVAYIVKEFEQYL